MWSSFDGLRCSLPQIFASAHHYAAAQKKWCGTGAYTAGVTAVAVATIFDGHGSNSKHQHQQGMTKYTKVVKTYRAHADAAAMVAAAASVLVGSISAATTWAADRDPALTPTSLVALLKE